MKKKLLRPLQNLSMMASEKCTKKVSSVMDVNDRLLAGTPAVAGTTVGKACIYRRQQPIVSNEHLTEEQVESQLAYFHQAVATARQELQSLSRSQSNGDGRDLLYAQIEMIEDPELHEKVEEEIKSNNTPVDAAIHKVFDIYLGLLSERENADSPERSVDIIDTRNRLIQILHNDENEQITKETIIIAHDLSPREVIKFSEQQVRGLVMEQGGESSHAVILARALQIPMVVRVEQACSRIPAGKVMAIDGASGKVIVDPSAEIQDKYRVNDLSTVQSQSTAVQYETADGHPFILRANIGFADELPAMLASGGEGIGLLRTESAYLNNGHLGSEQEQRSLYEVLLKETSPDIVTIRLFDAGGDKFFDLGQQEQNPNLGWRGIRMLLDEEKLIRQQLRAILIVAGRYPGRIRILVPMVSCLEEVTAVKKHIADIRQELKEKEYAVDADIELGIMVEVPAVALQADAFAREVDFLSIGTNDLTQYLLAVDRGNERLSNLYSQRHPALWSLIQQVSQSGDATDTPVSV